MSHLSYMYFSSPLNPQLLFYDGHRRYFNDRALDILQNHHIQAFMLKVGDSIHDQPSNNGPNLNLKNMYDNTRMNCMMKHGNLKFTPAHKNVVNFETWEDFKLSFDSITQDAFNKTHLPPLPPNEDKNHQYFLAATQFSKGNK